MKTGKIYGYARVSTKKQNLERQIKNIKMYDVEIKLYTEKLSGTKLDRPVWKNLQTKLKKGDTIVFDSVSRMSRDSTQGIRQYFNLMDKGVKLVFLKEPHINSEVYRKQMEKKINLNTDDEIIKAIMEGVNKALIIIAKEQIKLSFNQAEKEVKDLSERTKEGIREAKAKGKTIGSVKGQKYTTKRSLDSKNKIIKMSKKFDGNMKDKEVMEILKLSRNTYYKYIREIIDIKDKEHEKYCQENGEATKIFKGSYKNEK